MKNFLLLLSSVFILNANAQNSIQLINVVGTATTAMVPNSVTQLTVKSFQTKKFDIDIKNIGTTTNTYTATRYDVLLNRPSPTDTAAAFYCFAGSCFGAGTIVSPPLTLRSGVRASDTTLIDPTAEYFMLTADLTEAGVIGKSIVKYSFKNIAVAADSVQITLSYNGELSVLQIEKELSSFEVFPNPAKDVVELKILSNNSINSKSFVLNALGAVVLEKDLVLNAGENNIQLDIHALPTGVYFARVGNGSGYVTRKFIVN